MRRANLSRKSVTFWLILVEVVCLTIWMRGSTTLAQGNAPFVKWARAMKMDDTGMANPAGLVFSPRTNAFHVVNRRGQPATDTDVVRLTPFGERAGSARIAAALRDPINMAFDGYFNRLLAFISPANQLVEVREGTDGNLDRRTLVRHNARRFGLQNPQGLTVDPANGKLYILDSAGPSIVRIEPAADGSFDGAAFTTVDLRPTGLAAVRGLALDPKTGHLHLFSPADQRLYELSQDGQVVASRDLAEFGFKHPESMTFAPSGDLTDDPSELSLYIADSGLVDSRQVQAGELAQTEEEGADSPTPGGFQLYLPMVAQGTIEGEAASPSPETSEVNEPAADEVAAAAQETGQIVELSFTAAPAAAAATTQLPLIRTVLTSQYSPNSPDPSGLAFVPHMGTLLISDGEVDEMSQYFTGKNVFVSALAGNLLNTLTTISFSDEPAGAEVNPINRHLFFSDDTGTRSVYELNPGADGQYNTADDSVRSFKTADFASKDPEGLAYDPASGALFVIDGVNREVYRVLPGANGIFNGVPPAGDDQVTNFDTLSLGLDDPEGAAFNPNSGTLYAVGKPPTTLFEFTATGALVRTLDISAAHARKPAGLAVGPGSLDPTQMSVYIVDRGVDNNSAPKENDGKLYELALGQPWVGWGPTATPTNSPVPPTATNTAV
ncbi:MAG TPA: hypothetical protein PKE45_20960, partial [Caldilineaceae bacterium]|nr:hypothetical protein [Caldilineaceae bacterium]